MNEAEIVILRVWRGDTLWYEEMANTLTTVRILGPFEFEWIFEVERAGKKDRVLVPAGKRMSWEPILS